MHYNVAVLTTADSPSYTELLELYYIDKPCTPYPVCSQQVLSNPLDKNNKFFVQESQREYWLGVFERIAKIGVDMLADYTDFGLITGKDGNFYSNINFNGKWDWWMQGGKWENMLKLKGSDERTNSAKIKDIDFSPNREIYKLSLAFWDVVVENRPLKHSLSKQLRGFIEKECADFYKNMSCDAKLLIEPFKTRENYAMCQAGFSTYAVITPDGIWYECGGIYGGDMADIEKNADWYYKYHKRFINWYDNYFKRFILSADGETTMTIIDCHI